MIIRASDGPSVLDLIGKAEESTLCHGKHSNYPRKWDIKRRMDALLAHERDQDSRTDLGHKVLSVEKEVPQNSMWPTGKKKQCKGHLGRISPKC